jgi:hypothetical protein
MTSKGTVLLVVAFLGVATLMGMGGLIWLVGTTDVKDAGLLAVVAGPTGTALGALATLLASTRTEASPPVPVQVQNGPDAAVPVDAVA